MKLDSPWCNPSPAMIYPAIHELEAAGLIACEVDPANARKRRICHLTDSGREALAVGRKAWAEFLPAMMRVVGKKPAVAACDTDTTSDASRGG